jgi:hypothetical protein
MKPARSKNRPGGKEDPVAAAQLQVYGATPPEAVWWNPPINTHCVKKQTFLEPE